LEETFDFLFVVLGAGGAEYKSAMARVDGGVKASGSKGRKERERIALRLYASAVVLVETVGASHRAMFTKRGANELE
jgi:hypothetical protein